MTTAFVPPMLIGFPFSTTAIARARTGAACSSVPSAALTTSTAWPRTSSPIIWITHRKMYAALFRLPRTLLGFDLPRQNVWDSLVNPNTSDLRGVLARIEYREFRRTTSDCDETVHNIKPVLSHHGPPPRGSSLGTCLVTAPASVSERQLTSDQPVETAIIHSSRPRPPPRRP